MCIVSRQAREFFWKISMKSESDSWQWIPVFRCFTLGEAVSKRETREAGQSLTKARVWRFNKSGIFSSLQGRLSSSSVTSKLYSTSSQL